MSKLLPIVSNRSEKLDLAVSCAPRGSAGPAGAGPPLAAERRRGAGRLEYRSTRADRLLCLPGDPVRAVRGRSPATLTDVLAGRPDLPKQAQSSFFR